MWDASKHKRWRDGRFREMNLTPGWYEHETVGGRILRTYINDQNDFETGARTLHMAINGPSDKKDGDPFTRLHLTSTEEGEQMAYAVSDHISVGVINHDKEGPADDFSFVRTHDYQPMSQNKPEDQTAFGGRMANDSKNGAYTFDANMHEQANRDAFNQAQDKNQMMHITATKLAETQVKARHAYEQMGVSESEARHMPVYVFKGDDGELTITPAFTLDHTTGEMKRSERPKTVSNSPVALMRGDDITHMGRAMQEDGISDIDVCVSTAAGKDEDEEDPTHNALHFRAESENENSHDRTTMWGSIEDRTTAPVIRPSVQRGSGEYYRREVAARQAREQDAVRFYNPTDTASAVKLIRAKTGDRYAHRQDLQIVKHASKPENTLISQAESTHVERLYNGYGELKSRRAKDTVGFVELYNSRVGPSMRVDENKVQATSDGFYRARLPYRNSEGSMSEHWEYFNPRGERTRSRVTDDMYDMNGNRI